MVQEAYICSDNDGKVILNEFKITDIDISPKTKMIGSPVESGYESFDNKIIIPRSIKVSGYVHGNDFQNMEDTLDSMLTERAYKFYSVVSKVDVYMNMSLVDATHKESKDIHDAVEYNLEFTEVIEDSFQGMASSASDQNTRNYGTKN